MDKRIMTLDEIGTRLEAARGRTDRMPLDGGAVPAGGVPGISCGD